VVNIEAIDAQNALLRLVLFVVLNHGPLLQLFARKQSIQEVFLFLIVSRFTFEFFWCEITINRLETIAPSATHGESLRHAAHLLLLGDQLARKVSLIGVIAISAGSASVLLKGQFELLFHRLVNEDSLPDFKPVAFQVANDSLRVDDPRILAKSIVASKHVTQVLIFAILSTCLTRWDHKDILRRVRLDLALDFLGEGVDDLLDLLAIAHRDRQPLLVGQHCVTFYEHQSLVFRLQITAALLGLKSSYGLVLRAGTC